MYIPWVQDSEKYGRSHRGLPVVRHGPYVMREWSLCHAKSLSVMYDDCNHDSHMLQ